MLIELTAIINKIPRDQSTTTIPKPKGTTAQEMRAMLKPKIGAIMKTILLECVGTKHSFTKSFKPSAKGCIIPTNPTVLGPFLIWIEPKILRSAKVTNATEIKRGKIIPKDFIILLFSLKTEVQNPRVKHNAQNYVTSQS
jgi:hypothetical protein